MYGLFLFLFSLFVLTFVFCSNEEVYKMLRSARALRDSGDIQQLEKAKELYGRIISDYSNITQVKLYSSALYEYSMILENIADENDNDGHLYDISFELLTKAAELGHSLAQHELAAAYNTGIYGGLVPIDAAR